MGLGSGGLWVAVTFNVLDRWPGREYIYMSRVFAAYSLGGLIGPALGAIGGIAGPSAVYLLLILAALPLMLVLQPDRRRAFRPARSSLRLPGFWAASGGIVFAVIGLGVAEGVLPLHFAERLEQSEIGALYVGMSIVVAGAAVLAARFEPVSMVIGSALLVAAGLGVAGIALAPPVWIPALLVAGAGIGLGYTGSMALCSRPCPLSGLSKRCWSGRSWGFWAMWWAR